MVKVAGRSLLEVAVGPAVKLLASIRLVLVLALEVVLMSAAVGFEPWRMLLVLLSTPGNLALLHLWGRAHDMSSVSIWCLVVLDAFATLALAFAAFSIGGRSNSLGGAYLLLSALLVGLALSWGKTLCWLLCVLLPTAVFLRSGLSVSSWIMVVASLACFAALGRRMKVQMERVEWLVHDLLESRSKRAALEERLVIARDLHDTMAKSAAGVRMLAEGLRDDLEAKGAPEASVACALFDAADITSREARVVLDELRTEGSDDLRQCLAADVQRWAARTGVATEVQVQGEPARAGSTCAWHLQRSLGELLTNIERHAKAEKVCVRLNAAEGQLVVDVEDDGCGLPEQSLLSPGLQVGEGHYGLGGIQERVSSLGGSFSLNHSVLGGAKARIVVPV